MGSSGNSDFGSPPQGPAPPASMIAPQGQSVPFSPHFINFLGDTNQPSTGLSPDMLAQIAASNGPPGAGQMPPGGGMGGGPEMADLRQQLAALTAAQAAPARRDPMANWRDRGGGGSAGGRGGSAGGGGWGGH